MAGHEHDETTREGTSETRPREIVEARTERLPAGSLPHAQPPAASYPTPPPQAEPIIPTPSAEPDGALITYIGEPLHAAEVAGAARAAQDRAQRDVQSILATLGEIAVAMHRQARALEPVVEGQYSGDLTDPRTALLAESLAIARQADLRLAQIERALGRLTATVRAAQGNLGALESERERLATLYQIARDLNSSLDLDNLLGQVMAQLIEVVHAERGFLMLWDDATNALTFAAARGPEGQPLAERDFLISRSIVENVWRDQQPLLTTDAQDDERLRRHESVVVYRIRSVMCAPLRVRGRGVGVVYVDSRTDTALFDAAHLDLLAAFCNQAAIAIENARLFADLRRRIREIGEMKTYMENIFASIASGVVTADTQGVVTTFNQAAEQIFRVTGESAIGQPYQRVFASLGDASLAGILRRTVARQEVTLGHELDCSLPQRGEVTLRLNVSPLHSAEDANAPLGVAMVVDDLTELRRSQRQAEEIERLFGRYVHPAVVRQLLADPSAVTLGGETREISTIFADIRGYTQLAERLAPDQLVRILNAYLDILTEAVWREEGTLTMFIGDALMAIFNAPLPQPDHAQRAVRAAWAMRRALEEFHAAQRTDALPVNYGIGVHTGLAVVGNIGARTRMQNYTAIGDAVNIAQRLQAAAGAGQILLSDVTQRLTAPLVQARPLEPLLVKGKSLPLQVWALEGLRSAPVV